MSGYLPLSGGTLTGTVITNTDDAFKRSTDAAGLAVFGGTAIGTGAILKLLGKDSS